MDHRRLPFARLALALPCLACLAACQQEPQDPENAARQKVLHDAGLAVPLTIHPVFVLGRPNVRVAQVVGLILERHGMPDLEVAEAPFQPAADAPWEKVAAAFADHVRGTPAGKPGRHHLYAEFLGTPHEGATEVRFVVVDAAGQPALVDRQTPADRDFKRTAGRDPDPLGCASLVGERLFTLADWKKAPTAVPDGKFAKMWREMSGMPDPKEQKAIDERRAALGKSVKSSRFVLMPTLVDGKHDAASAARLADLLAAEFGCQATAKADGARIEVKPDSNEQKRLWDLAWGLRDAVRKQPADASVPSQHTLVVDVANGPGGTPGFVHVVICNAAGEHVVVDMQNDQHEMLRRAAPKTLEEAEQFAVKRLAKLLQ